MRQADNEYAVVDWDAMLNTMRQRPNAAGTNHSLPNSDQTQFF
jgi:hypothetical protein